VIPVAPRLWRVPRHSETFDEIIGYDFRKEVLNMGSGGLHKLAFLLLVIGGLQWGLSGAFGVDVIGRLGEAVAKVVYILVGLSAIYELSIHGKTCRFCKPGASV